MTNPNGTQPKPPTKKANADPGEAFARFWAAYPRKTAKQDAARAWLKIAPDDTLVATILAAVEKQKRWEQWRKDSGKFIPHPATWLNGARWEDAEPDSLPEPPDRTKFVNRHEDDNREIAPPSMLFDLLNQGQGEPS